MFCIYRYMKSKCLNLILTTINNEDFFCRKKISVNVLRVLRTPEVIFYYKLLITSIILIMMEFNKILSICKMSNYIINI